jgi:hypothetical protein
MGRLGHPRLQPRHPRHPTRLTPSPTSGPHPPGHHNPHHPTLERPRSSPEARPFSFRAVYPGQVVRSDDATQRPASASHTGRALPSYGVRAHSGPRGHRVAQAGERESGLPQRDNCTGLPRRLCSTHATRANEIDVAGLLLVVLRECLVRRAGDDRAIGENGCAMMRRVTEAQLPGYCARSSSP